MASIEDKYHEYNERLESLKFKFKRDSSIGEMTRVAISKQIEQMQGFVDTLKELSTENTPLSTPTPTPQNKKAYKMSQKLIDKLSELFILQDEMNSMVSPTWITSGWNFLRAARMEAFEAIDSLPWKWWKKGAEADWSNVRVELVDILHFIISATQVSQSDKSLLPNVALNHIELAHGRSLNKEEAPSVIIQLESLIEDTFTATTIQDHYDLFGRLFLIWDKVSKGDDFEENIIKMFDDYIVKNILNRFRQDNGYKTGGYQKLWHGKEDNVWAYTLMDETTTPEQLYLKLGDIYEQHLKTVPPTAEA